MRKRKWKLGEVSYSPKVDGMIDSGHTPIPARLQHRILTMCCWPLQQGKPGKKFAERNHTPTLFFLLKLSETVFFSWIRCYILQIYSRSKLGYSWAKWYGELYYSRNITLLLVTKAIASLIKPMILCIFFFVSFLAMKYGIQDFSSPTRDWTRTTCSGSSES